MEGIRERSRHHHRIFTGKSDDIASLLALPNMDAHKLWNLTSHSKQSMIKEVGIGILLPKLFWPTMRKKCSSDREKLLKFMAEGQEFSKGDQQSEIFKALKMRASYSFWDRLLKLGPETNFFIRTNFTIQMGRKKNLVSGPSFSSLTQKLWDAPILRALKISDCWSPFENRTDERGNILKITV